MYSTYSYFQVYRGNQDTHTIKVSYLEHTVRARFIRIHIEAWHNHPSLRMEVLGCQECNSLISELPSTQLESSSTGRRKKSKDTCTPADGHIYSAGGWCPRRTNGQYFIKHQSSRKVGLSSLKGLLLLFQVTLYSKRDIDSQEYLLNLYWINNVEDIFVFPVLKIV